MKSLSSRPDAARYGARAVVPTSDQRKRAYRGPARARKLYEADDGVERFEQEGSPIGEYTRQISRSAEDQALRALR